MENKIRLQVIHESLNKNLKASAIFVTNFLLKENFQGNFQPKMALQIKTIVIWASAWLFLKIDWVLGYQSAGLYSRDNMNRLNPNELFNGFFPAWSMLMFGLSGNTNSITIYSTRASYPYS